ncbi:MAG: hypothetical protein QM802_24475 [Agriterribacter sp.]
MTKKANSVGFNNKREFLYLDNINDANYLVALLNDSTEIEAERIGFTGEKSVSYQIFKRLSFISSDTALLQLTKHKNPKIRVYAMWALTEKNRQLALMRMDQLKNDNETVIYSTGCIILPEKVAWLIASKFDTTEVNMLPKRNSGYLDFDVVQKGK